MSTLLLLSPFLRPVAQQLLVSDAGSRVYFTIKNFGLKVGGHFAGLKGNIVFDPSSLASARFNVTLEANTIDTDNKKRDNHLRQETYFYVEKYPLIKFASGSIKRSGGEGFLMEGKITVKGITKPVSFPFSVTPQNNGYLFKGSFQLNRRDFGVGGKSITMSDEVIVSLDVFGKK